MRHPLHQATDAMELHVLSAANWFARDTGEGQATSLGSTGTSHHLPITTQA